MQTAAQDIISGRYWPRRYTVVGLFFLATVLCYLDRVSISIAIIPLARERGYDAAARGLVLSGFFWGYIWPQLPGGWLSDRFGGRRVLAFGVGLWSLATLLTPPASRAFATLLAVRMLLGLGEGVNFPAIHSIAARWTLESERARAVSLNFSGMYLGTVIAFVLSPPIILALGWPALFYLPGIAGVIWTAVWLWKVCDRPAECPGISADELAALTRRHAEAAHAQEIPWSAIAREKAVWAIVLAHFCSNFGFNILLLWLPSYLNGTMGVPLARVGAYSLIPWIATFAAANIGGWIADTMRRRGVSVTAIRKILQSLAFAGGALPLLFIPAVSTPAAATALVTLSTAMSSLGLSGQGVNHLDVGPRYAGVLMGITNTVATIPGIVGVAAAGFIWRATGSFAAVFYVIAAVYLIGLVGYDLWGSGERKL